jgi:8-oxo-dGTP diphosphatase
MSISKFNIRVYGLAIHDGKILVADEILQGKHVTKFPGGGLEFGEGIIDCLHREFMEELNAEIENLDLFYGTDFFQQSSFDPTHQVICIYYTCRLKNPDSLKTTTKKFDFKEEIERAESFRWQNLNSLKTKEFAFPIDKVVVEKLIKET